MLIQVGWGEEMNFRSAYPFCMNACCRHRYRFNTAVGVISKLSVSLVVHVAASAPEKAE